MPQSLGRGTDYLTSPPKKGTLRTFIYRKIQRRRLGLNPRTWEPEASMQTTRPLKPSLQQFTSDSFAHPKTSCGSCFQIHDSCHIMKPYIHIF
jgi:hypothetical protein